MKYEKGDLAFMKNMIRRNYNIDLLRVLAALLIVMFHYTTRYAQLYGYDNKSFHLSITYGGAIGNAMFLILTSFFTINSAIKSQSTKDFFIKRMIRLYPTYTLCLTITFISVSLFGLQGRETSTIDYFLNLFFLNYFLGTNYVDGAHWFMSFQMMMILILLILKKINYIKKLNVYYVWIFINIIIRFLLKFGNQSIVDILNIIKIFTLESYAPYIIIGIGLRFLLDKKASFKEVTGLFIISYFNILINEGIIVCTIALIITGLIAVIIFRVPSNKGVRFKNYLIFISGVSYPLYLIHQNIGYQIRFYLISLGLKSEVFIFIPLIISIGLATMIHHFFEKPVTNYLDKVMKML
ncbi:MAG: acyltransferase [Clostridium beijerinckii]|nr:acyltransferase [Clostridium beijerinckii]